MRFPICDKTNIGCHLLADDGGDGRAMCTGARTAFLSSPRAQRHSKVPKDASPIAHFDHPFVFRTSSPPPAAFRKELSAALLNALPPVV
jgi:hypothetical protein